ncbi:MAG TPA: hypothetical protein VFK76_09550 [Gaiellaceae bacterium]|nr:hypothetical protein [Gaiellaceae bacterium]
MGAEKVAIFQRYGAPGRSSSQRASVARTKTGTAHVSTNPASRSEIVSWPWSELFSEWKSDQSMRAR